ncbi:hypothetical protein ES319_D10G132000v1 [Gossypium barbadense]|uniref:Uncharacterized protein n=1 Tax=Gossypium barbadense TaxID=3634 RepID=A0A5J5PR55_GOSBA|nr:hypothetical protein ES319_D10G132000v1 [Gossypium barbadense]
MAMDHFSCSLRDSQDLYQRLFLELWKDSLFSNFLVRQKKKRVLFSGNFLIIVKPFMSFVLLPDWKICLNCSFNLV